MFRQPQVDLPFTPAWRLEEMNFGKSRYRRRFSMCKYVVGSHPCRLALIPSSGKPPKSVPQFAHMLGWSTDQLSSTRCLAGILSLSPLAGQAQGFESVRGVSLTSTFERRQAYVIRQTSYDRRYTDRRYTDSWYTDSWYTDCHGARRRIQLWTDRRGA